MTSPQEGGKEVLRAQFASVQGDRGNPSYSRELDATDDVIVPTVTSTTGHRGNPHYSAELDSTPQQQQPSPALVAQTLLWISQQPEIQLSTNDLSH